MNLKQRLLETELGTYMLLSGVGATVALVLGYTAIGGALTAVFALATVLAVDIE